MPNELGDYARYYAALRAALAGCGANPVEPSEAIDVMRVIEAGLASSERSDAVALSHRAALDDG